MKISENTAKKPIFFILSGRFISTPFPYNEDIHHKFEHRAIIYSTTDWYSVVLKTSHLQDLGISKKLKQHTKDTTFSDSEADTTT